MDVIQHAEEKFIIRIPESNPGGPVSMSAGKNKQYTHTVADSTQRNTVIMQKPGPSYLASPQRNTVITQKPGPGYLANTQEPSAGYVNTRSPGLSANVGQELHIVETPYDRNQIERRKILEATGLADSDDDKTNETIQPQANDQNLVDGEQGSLGTSRVPTTTVQPSAMPQFITSQTKSTWS